jgi:hypothetical protein
MGRTQKDETDARWSPGVVAQVRLLALSQALGQVQQAQQQAQQQGSQLALLLVLAQLAWLQSVLWCRRWAQQQGSQCRSLHRVWPCS